MKYVLLLAMLTGVALVELQGGAFAAEAGVVNVETENAGYHELVAWVKSYGGRVDDRMAIRNMDGIRGVVALADIEEGMELLHCPWKLVIGSSGLGNQMETEEDMCDVVKMMAQEYRLGEESMGWPYLNYIDLPRLGATWGQAALDELQDLPPSQDIDRHLQWFSQNCRAGNQFDDKATMQALVAFISRANAVGMTPIYDLLNHHNGLKNAKLFLSEDGVDLRTVQPIQKGQQLYLSYGLKTSSQMYRDYGFVEAWPSLWSWKDSSTQDNHVFALFPDGITAIYPSPEFLKEIWKSPTIRSLAQCQENAAQYTQSLGVDQLMRFTLAAKNLLDGLPTTWQEDEENLRRKKDERTELPDEDSGSITGLEDVMAAIQYRLTFKQAVSAALSSSEAVLRGLKLEL